MPEPGEPPLEDSHVVSIIARNPDLREFCFLNSWGEEWGDNGMGYLPYEYFDRYVFGSWAVYIRPHYESHRKTQRPGCQELQWVLRDESGHRIYGLEVCSKDGHDRWGWAYVVERDGALEVEELFVRHEFRTNGLGKSLTQRILKLANAKQMSLRLWVPFADSKQENPDNFDAIVAVARHMRLEFQPCTVRWAAYFATNEGAGSQVPVEPPEIPPRPKSALEKVLAAAMLVTPGLEAPYSQPTAKEVAVASPDSPDVGTESWRVMNQRRAELIRKKNREGVTTQEDAELNHLQAISLAALRQLSPTPVLDESRLEELENRLSKESEE